ncbi:TetR/AcrR family transcriptional regulator [Actinophytocola gossypii]|uniref:TetR/AcrR family transcriptional regulator n=1 Tax=Actinophytocola gossypii TaxID=2812003 RepID=A0ABT2J375_9PSEU|nr:TetR/AcrR family transcriptional regulator [Actinophytocola gossypii]MCT2582226.1 TetR/AcrR family transcriptional regulator [Actinophytocola gossypii]
MTEQQAGARKRGRPTEVERAQRRDEVLDAAVRLFGAGGFQRVSLDDIASEAHVTKRTIYKYFGDRNDIFLAAVERLRQRTLTLTPDDHPSLIDLAASIVHGLHSDEAIALHRLMIAEAHRFPELADRFYRDGPESYIRAIATALPEVVADRAEHLFALLLGEPHRRRLLGLSAAPTYDQARAQASAVLKTIGALD